MSLKNLKLLNRDLLDDKDYASLQEIIRTQMYGVPLEPTKGAVMTRMNSQKFREMMINFRDEYGNAARDLILRAESLSPEEARMSVKFLKRAETLHALSNTHSEANEAFRRANIEKGNDYTGTHTSYWRRLEILTGVGEKHAERVTIQAQHFYN